MVSFVFTLVRGESSESVLLEFDTMPDWNDLVSAGFSKCCVMPLLGSPDSIIIDKRG